MKFRGVSAKVNFALDGLPVFPALPDTVDHFGGFLNIGPTIEYVERAFDAAKYGWYSESPSSTPRSSRSSTPTWPRPASTSCRASCSTRRTSCAAATGRPSASSFGDKAQAVLESHFPGFGDLVLHREVVTPVDIETRTGLTEGNIFAGEFLAPQMYFFRPAPGLEPVRHPDRRLLPVRLRHPPGRLRDRCPGQAGQPAGAARPAALSVPAPPSLVTVLREWGRLGCVGFGGPPAHIRLLRDLCVQREGWIEEVEFEDAIATCNLLPGPSSTQLAIFCGWRVRGRLGAVVGGAVVHPARASS